MPNFSRRSILKFLIVVSTALVIAPLATAARFLNIPYVFKPVRALLQGASTMENNSSLDFQWPTLTRPFDTNLLIRDDNGNYTAFNRVCTHLQCFVNYDPVSQTIQCPCHGSTYDPQTGEVISGPAPRPLPIIDLEIDENGDVYAVNAEGEFGYGRTASETSTATSSSGTSTTAQGTVPPIIQGHASALPRSGEPT